MPRTVRATAKEVQKSRADWYQFHYKNRQRAQTLSPHELLSYQTAARMISPPQMTVFGGVAHDWPEPQAYRIAKGSGLDINLINPWYLSNEGWDQFQSRWQQLPEPVDILSTPPCVQVGELYPLYTMPEDSKPGR